MISNKHNSEINSGYLKAVNDFNFFKSYSHIRSYLQPHSIILAYHRICPISNPWSLVPINPNNFELQLKYLINNYKILSLIDLAKMINKGEFSSKRTAVITIDDGYKDCYTYVFPLIKKYNVPITIFLTTGPIKNKDLFWWDKLRYGIWNSNSSISDILRSDIKKTTLNGNKSKIMCILEEHMKKMPEIEKNKLLDKILNRSNITNFSDLSNDLILTWDEIKEMNEYGVDFGAHTITHPILTNVSPIQAKDEIFKSKEDIERILGNEVLSFAYPNGTPLDFNSKIIRWLKEAGFKSAVTTISGLSFLNSDAFMLRRILPDNNLNKFYWNCSGIVADLKYLYNGVNKIAYKR